LLLLQMLYGVCMWLLYADDAVATHACIPVGCCWPRHGVYVL